RLLLVERDGALARPVLLDHVDRALEARELLADRVVPVDDIRLELLYLGLVELAAVSHVGGPFRECGGAVGGGAFGSPRGDRWWVGLGAPPGTEHGEGSAAERQDGGGPSEDHPQGGVVAVGGVLGGGGHRRLVVR